MRTADHYHSRIRPGTTPYAALIAIKIIWRLPWAFLAEIFSGLLTLCVFMMWGRAAAKHAWSSTR